MTKEEGNELSVDKVIAKLLGHDPQKTQATADFQNYNDCWDISYYNEIYGNKTKKIVKRIIRKLCAPIGIPIIDKQRRFNMLVAERLNELSNSEMTIRRQADDIVNLKTKLDRFEAYMMRDATGGDKQ